jgi:hypothetical protein
VKRYPGALLSKEDSFILAVAIVGHGHFLNLSGDFEGVREKTAGKLWAKKMEYKSSLNWT